MKTNIITFVLVFLSLTNYLIYSQTNFVEYPHNPVIQGTADEWDAFIIDRGSVLYEDGKYHMYYSAQKEPFENDNYKMDIGYAWSNDGISWEKDTSNPILQFNRYGWENNGFNDLVVLKIDDSWHMWYTILPDFEEDFSIALGYATSPDGLTWTKYGEPLDFDASEDDWDSKSISPEDIIYNGEKFIMYYLGDTRAGNLAFYDVGVAESEDGITSVRDTLNNPVIRGYVPESYNVSIWALDVMYDENNADAPYQMWYTGYTYNGEREKVFYSKSYDGKNWVENDQPIFFPEEESWAKLAYDDMEVLCVDSLYRIWVYGINGGTVSDGYGAGVGYFTSPIITGLSETNLPNEYFLSQNYPNPFNPATTIKYSIPVDSKQYAVGSRKNQENETPLLGGAGGGLMPVELVVYDLLGREVASLVNEQQRPGNYEVKWDASGQASGVYFYKLVAGSYTDIKKMVLLR